ncbi:lectin like domain-containing protein [Planctomycetota bacterium]
MRRPRFRYAPGRRNLPASYRKLVRNIAPYSSDSVSIRVYSWLFLLLLGVCVSASVGLAGDLALQDGLAPLSPEFMDWNLKESMLMFERGEAGGRTFGRVPSPLDWSHLETQGISLMNRTAPAKFDLRQDGFVTAVRNQGFCGACWTFGTYGALESAILMAEGQTYDFSENHLKNHHGFDFTPCQGGNEDMGIAYLIRWAGPVSESDDPYHDWDDRPSPGGPCRKFVKTVLRYSSRGEIKNAIMDHGAVHAWMFHEDSYYDSLTDTYYYDGHLDEGDGPNHDITIVGWDDTKSVEGTQAKGAWIVKNSWGRLFGEQGYFYIAYHDAKAVKQALGYYDAVPTSTYLNNYQYDPLGRTTSWGGQETAWGANVFTAKANETLSAVGFYALAKNTAYEIRIYDRFDGRAFSELLASVEGALTFPGYHTIELPFPVSLEAGDDFGIAVELTTPGYNYPVPLEKPLDGYNTGAEAHAGESFVSWDGFTFMDVNDGIPNTSVCIKGLTVRPGDARPDVLICGAGKEDVLEDVRQKLEETGRFNAVGAMSLRETTPTLADLLAFDAVLVYRNYGYEDPAALGDAMADYVDAGGGVVCTMFEVASSGTTMRGRWDAEQYHVIPRGKVESGSRATLGTVHDPGHPIMQGVSAFDGGVSSYRPSTLEVMPDAVRIADFSDGRPLVVTKIIGGVRRVDLGFYPVSSDVNDKWWDASTDGAILMANALTWVSGSASDEAAVP